jgi:ribulose 1,5-bisphosphate synthetase/thiazole synthase
MPDSNLNKGVEWPYPVNYGRENEVDADVLILGGGVAGSHAAINAAKRGAKVVVVDKGAVIRSGSGGAGVDHWHGACTNPCSTVTLEERKQLLLLVRETPLHIGHLRNMERLCEMGAIIIRRFLLSTISRRQLKISLTIRWARCWICLA